MDEDLIRIIPDKEKAKSILKMTDTTLKMIKEINIDKFSSNITKEYYEIIRELMTIILLLDGYKTYGEGSHKKLIEYLELNYREFDKSEIYFIDDLRNIRNKIAYDGFFVEINYILNNIKNIQRIIEKLNKIIENKLKQTGKEECTPKII